MIDSRTGEVKNSNCECAAGKGDSATCKHIVGVLLMLARFVATGSLNVQLTCTETLQSFKKPSKVHGGPPMRAEELGRGAKDYDPRPPEFRNMEGYAAIVRNATINFCSNTGLDITQRYAYEKANVLLAVREHDYMKDPLHYC